MPLFSLAFVCFSKNKDFPGKGICEAIGSDIESVLSRFLSGMPRRLSVATGPVMMNSVLIEVDDYGKAKSVERIDRKVE